jgi:hypothetical protein
MLRRAPASRSDQPTDSTGTPCSAADAMLAEDEAAAEPSTRLVRGPRFTKVDSVWTALVQQVPDLRDVFALGDEIRVRGRTVLVEITESGVSELSASQLAALSSRW